MMYVKNKLGKMVVTMNTYRLEQLSQCSVKDGLRLL